MVAPANRNDPPRLPWVEPLRALALVGILWNHFVEAFGVYPWFTNPANNWPDFATRIKTLFPQADSLPVALFQFVGWLGDSGPGVFLFLSGLGLTLGMQSHERTPGWIVSFYRRRLLRIFPLYIAAHFVVFAGAILARDQSTVLAGPRAFLSLFGIRFTDSLFFAFNPSWWFVWLILQLYLVYPLLLLLLERIGMKRFLAACLLVTLGARLWGILYSSSLYYWMTGMFFGTRLAEFAAGMVLARYLGKGGVIPGARWTGGVSAALYLVGFGCSLTLPATLLSNLLITLGLTGLFHMLWTAALRRIPGVAALLEWVGRESYGVFLVHQPFIGWAVWGLPEAGIALRLALGASAVLLSFPLAWAVRNAVERLPGMVRRLPFSGGGRALPGAVASGLLAALAVAEPRLAGGWQIQILYWCLALAILLLLFLEVDRGDRGAWWYRWLCASALVSGAMQLFVLSRHSGRISVALGAALASSIVLMTALLRRPILGWVAGLTAAGIAFAGGETALRRWAPLETGVWGELPALEIHPTRTYALRPRQTTRLKYNNYDYVVETNSLGLVGPEIPPTKDGELRVLVLGDAFTMPEGMKWDRAYPALLERELNGCRDCPRVRVINAGVTGYGPAEEWPQLAELGPLLHPDVVIYQFFINEFQEASVIPEDRLAEIGLRRRESLRSVFLGRSQMLAWLQRLEMLARERVTGRSSEWRRWKALLAFYESGDNELYSDRSVSTVRDYLRKMQDLCRRIDARFLVCFVPGAVAVSAPSDIAYFPWDVDLSDRSRYDLNRPLDALLSIARETGIAVLDLTPDLRRHVPQPVYFPESWHWNESGHQVVARTIAAALTQSGALRGHAAAASGSGTP